MDRLIFQIERENLVDVYGIVHDLRMHRSLMVQTEVGPRQCLAHNTSALWANVLGFSAGSVRIPKPVRLGHHQVQNRNQCGPHLPEHGSSFHLWEHRTTQESLQVLRRIDPRNHSSLLAPTSVKGTQVVLYKLCKPALVVCVYIYCVLVHSNFYSVVFISWIFARGGGWLTFWPNLCYFSNVTVYKLFINADVLCWFCLFTTGLGYFAQVICWMQ